MKNIRVSLTNYCNRNCEYCFSKGKVSSKKDEMSMDDFEFTLKFCEKNEIREIILFGGEPTSHTHFKEIIEILQRRGFFYLLLTNGLFDPSVLDLLSKKKDYPVLLNYNHPDTFKNAGEWELVNRNIARMINLGVNVNLGYNVYEKNPDYRFFIDAIKKLNISKIRCDLARPSMTFENKHFDINDFFSMVPVITKFLKECIEAGAAVNLDCPFPMCMLLKKDFNFLHKNIYSTWLRTDCPGDAITIDPGLKIAACPPAGVDFENITLRDFENVDQAAAFVKKTVYHIKWGNYPLADCADCIFRLLKQCQGGCLGHKRDTKSINKISRSELDEFIKSYNNSEQEDTADDFTNDAVARAANACEEKLRKGIKDSFILYSIGNCYEALGDYEKAIKFYGDAVEFDKTHILAKDRLNLVYQLKALQGNPNNYKSWKRLEEILKRIYSAGDVTFLIKYYKNKFAKFNKS